MKRKKEEKEEWRKEERKERRKEGVFKRERLKKVERERTV